MDSTVCHHARREVFGNTLDPRYIIVPVGVIRFPQPDLGEVFLWVSNDIVIGFAPVSTSIVTGMYVRS